MEYKELLIEKNTSIHEALNRLDTLRPKILFVVENDILMGSLTDGDIRRYLLNDGKISDSVYDACNKNPKKVAKSLIEARAMLSKDYIAIPVIDENKKVLDIYWGENSKAHTVLNVPIVINAGGKGTRLEPFTKVLPKPLIPVGDYPIIEHIIHAYEEYGCHEFKVIVNYKKELIKAYFNEVDKDYRIEFIDEDKPLGTGGGLSLLKNKINEPFFFVSCDSLLLEDYGKIYQKHIDNKNDITVILADRKVNIPYGVVNVDKNGEYLNISEKPQYTFLTNIAMYIVNPDIINDIEDDMRIDFPDIIEKEKEKGKKIGTYIVSEDKWLDMGVMPELEKMRSRLYGE
ncbi:MAG: sugar phosphate nucleotidyltransferase [Erysipelotrichaceae bacterium]|nr:sugar phosphate nucleotidyltransferase [Erysipelotrichaceae bacterium]